MVFRPSGPFIMDQNKRHTKKERPLSLDSSMIYSLLPSAVQSRLPKLPSIRKTVCTYAFDIELQTDGHGTKPTLSTTDYSSEIVLRDTQTADGSKE